MINREKESNYELKQNLASRSKSPKPIQQFLSPSSTNDIINERSNTDTIETENNNQIKSTPIASQKKSIPPNISHHTKNVAPSQPTKSTPTSPQSLNKTPLVPRTTKRKNELIKKSTTENEKMKIFQKFNSLHHLQSPNNNINNSNSSNNRNNNNAENEDNFVESSDSESDQENLFPHLPLTFVKKSFDSFNKMKISNDVYSDIKKGSQLFFQQVVDDLASSVVKSKRKTILKKDMELLLKRQGIVNERQSLEDLIHQYLPRELVEEIIPIAKANNKTLP